MIVLGRVARPLKALGGDDAALPVPAPGTVAGLADHTRAGNLAHGENASASALSLRGSRAASRVLHRAWGCHASPSG